MFALLAAIKAAPSPPAPLPPAATPLPVGTPAPTPPLIRPEEAPVDYWQHPTWVYVVAGVVAAVLLAVLAYYLIKWARTPAPVMPPRPRTIALAELERLRPETNALDPYAFSIAVSDVLRRYIEAQYLVPALEQTSPEFLAAIAKDVHFSPAERRLLGDFLEVCDQIKFARVGADLTVNETLLQRAFAFVRGGFVEGVAV
ncbi:MAG TPA: DUF4381 family protein [Chthoniobacteraceae bacterium]|jgi:hypothetical protein|nr:DUF4381 family protein [Chthoniobacteraceae bacterium]